MLFAQEKKALTEGADVVICTPGRMIAHLNMGYVKLDGLKYLVLDEADRMLDMGFHDDIQKMIRSMPSKRQNLLFSATMPPSIRTLAKKILHEPEEISISISKPPEAILQQAFVVYEPQKMPLIKELLKGTDFQSIVVFCSRKQDVKTLTQNLKRAGLNADEIHSDLEQAQREEVLLQFRSRRLRILVATDILSRGIDIEDIDLVINYEVPGDGEDYVHRIGRTARAASKGTAYTFITEREQRKFAAIEQLIGKEVEKVAVPEKFGPTPAWQPNLRRPAGGSGRGGGKGDRPQMGGRPNRGPQGSGRSGGEQRGESPRRSHGPNQTGNRPRPQGDNPGHRGPQRSDKHPGTPPPPHTGDRHQ
jgi:superfamily II DNA/RNA helicase